jgi:hypothetical protein
MAMCVKTVKEAYLIDVAIPNRCNLYSNLITEKLQKCTSLKAELNKFWQLNAVYTVPIGLFYNGDSTPSPPTQKKIHDTSKLLTLRRRLYILKQTAVIFNTRHVVQMLLAGK